MQAPSIRWIMFVWYDLAVVQVTYLAVLTAETFAFAEKSGSVINVPMRTFLPIPATIARIVEAAEGIVTG